MAAKPIAHRCAHVTPLSNITKITNRRIATQLAERLIQQASRAHVDDWRSYAENEIAIALDAATNCRPGVEMNGQKARAIANEIAKIDRDREGYVDLVTIAILAGWRQEP
jgi:hypothetical protein